MEDDRNSLEGELGRAELKDRGFSSWFALWYLHRPGTGESTDFGMRGVLVALAFMAVFVLAGAVVLYVYR